MTDITVAAIADMVGGRLVGDGSRAIRGLGDLKTGGADRIGFVRDRRYVALAETTKLGAVLSKSELRTPASLIVVPNVDVAYAKIALTFHPTPRASAHTIHPTAVVDPRAEIGSPVQIGPHAVIGKCTLGAGTVVMSGVSIGDGAVLGRDCVLYPNVVVYHGVQIGDRVIVQAGSVIGSDGFGYARDGTSWIKVPQLGTVRIAEDVEIGAGCTVDRGTLTDTRIGARTKIDNLCHVAHNCVLGVDVVMAANSGVAGSTTIGDRCVIGGSTGISGHLSIGADVRFGGGSVVLRDVKEAGDYMGHPLMEKRLFLRLLREQRRLVEGRDDGGDRDE
ncbi:MAG: UDP-3-O-(3-hydroxymyristoyl)glucosamine N-acyltransferase [Planctomycetes bacterium]|nr:UDP-3-O-(3-hydroxymyristoyl)glucosamine N-acyltransferase [Planctomycetota bacterium]